MHALAAEASPCLISIRPKKRVKRLRSGCERDRSVGALARRHSSASLGTDTFTGHSGTCPGSRRRYSSKANSERGPHRARLLHQSLQEGISGAWPRGCSRGFPSGSPAPHFPVWTPSCSAPAPAERQGAAGGARRAPLFPHTVLRFNHGESCPPAMLSKPRKKKDKEQPRPRRQG